MIKKIYVVFLETQRYNGGKSKNARRASRAQEEEEGRAGEGKFYLTDEAGRRIFGPGPAELLEQVERTGSLRAAAGKMGLSYSKALKILHTAERGLAMPLVSTEAGGLGGGGSTITPQARALLAWFRQARRAVEETARAQLDRLPRDG